jgi:hypothetical protein
MFARPLGTSGASLRAALATVGLGPGLLGCASAGDWLTVGPHATAQEMANAQELRVGVDRRCLSAEVLERNERVAIVSYKVGGMPHYVAFRASDYPNIGRHARYVIQPDQCQLSAVTTLSPRSAVDLRNPVRFRRSAP